MAFGVYIHIPFCLKKCDYCAFPSRPVSSIPEGEYVDAVLGELASLGHSFRGRTLSTLYIGGGTPSLFSPESIGTILRGVKDFFLFPPDQDGVETTLEANPGTVDRDNLAGYREAGINRLSLGFQSLRDHRLKILGRIHSAAQTYESFSHAQKAGFSNISVDMIFGSPGHEVEAWGEELRETAALRPQHMSVYELTVEEGTPLYRHTRNNSTFLPDEDVMASLHVQTHVILAGAGFEHYEVSNYAVPGLRSRHNENYWARGEYLGLGAGAHSFMEGKGEKSWGIRWWNKDDPYEYMSSVRTTGGARMGVESLTIDQAMTETLFLGLRRREGLDMDNFAVRFGKAPFEAFPGVTELMERGMLSINGTRLILPEAALLLTDGILAELMSSPDRNFLTLT